MNSPPLRRLKLGNNPLIHPTQSLPPSRGGFPFSNPIPRVFLRDPFVVIQIPHTGGTLQQRPVQAAVLDGFGDMRSGDQFHTLQVSDRARNFQDAGVGPGREAEFVDRLL